MPKYFMGGTHLESLERMMMDPSRPDPSRSNLQKKKPRKKQPGSQPAEQHPPEHERGEVYDKSCIKQSPASAVR